MIIFTGQLVHDLLAPSWIHYTIRILMTIPVVILVADRHSWKVYSIHKGDFDSNVTFVLKINYNSRCYLSGKQKDCKYHSATPGNPKGKQ